jgi:hypothetical protein
MIVLLGLAIVVWLVVQSISDRSAASAAEQRENAWLPMSLRQAELLFAEPRAMKIDRPVRAVAKVDRAYRLPDSSVTPVELKTRMQHHVYDGDVMELSVQRLVLEGNNIGPVGDIAYVITQDPVSGTRRRHVLRLMPRASTAELVTRYQRIRGGKERGVKADDPLKCRGCAYLKDCRPPSMNAA